MNEGPASSEPPMRDLLEEARLSLAADRVLVTEVTADTQYVLLSAGTPLPSFFGTRVPLSHSICQHVIGMRFPLSIEDGFSHPLLKGSPAVEDLRIGAYLGFPFGAEFPRIAMCALSDTPRPWSSQDRYTMNDTISRIRRFQAPQLREQSEVVRRR